MRMAAINTSVASNFNQHLSKSVTFACENTPDMACLSD
jgi:hypothetical protein